MDIKDEGYYKNVRPEMLRYIPNSAKTILEIGCGSGNFSAQLVKEGVETWGVEPFEKSAKEATQKLTKVLVGTLDDTLKDLPDKAKRYIHALEDFIEARISSISTSPEREDTILVEDPFNN